MQIKDLLNNKSRYEIIKRNLKEDHLKEGIGSYIYTKTIKKINPYIFINKKKYTKIKYESSAYYITQRVLYPDKDIIKQKPCAKRILSAEKNKKSVNNGIFKSFIDKTPFSFPVKIRKNINRSFDNSWKDNDIFLNNNNDLIKTERIFGVERKRIYKNHNYESDFPKYKFQKKLFFEKALNVNKIYI